MSPTELSVGIDFGTTKSVIAWWNPATTQAFCANEEPTLSLVYFHRDGDVSIGKEVQEILEGRQHLQSEEYEGFALSIKRHLNAGSYWYVNGRKKTVVDVVAAILGRLKEDAEDRLHQKITRAVITHPSKFGPAKEKIIRTAALTVGFRDVELLSEPEAAAIAYQRIERSQSQHILIFDFGGGTCNVAALTRQPDQQFKVISSRCLEQCGGDDLNEALYDYIDEECMRLKGRPLSPKEQTRDLRILRHCKVLKESLSDERERTFSSLLYSADGPDLTFEYPLTRAIFENCIRGYIEQTMQATQEVINEARLQGCEIEAVVMLGGSSKIPLVKSSLTKVLDDLTVLRKDYRKLQAVAIGAAYHAALLDQQSSP